MDDFYRGRVRTGPLGVVSVSCFVPPINVVPEKRVSVDFRVDSHPEGGSVKSFHS